MWDDEDYEPEPFESSKPSDKWDGEDEDVSYNKLRVGPRCMRVVGLRCYAVMY